jgi:hypothetical protein
VPHRSFARLSPAFRADRPRASSSRHCIYHSDQPLSIGFAQDLSTSLITLSNLNGSADGVTCDPVLKASEAMSLFDPFVSVA